MSIAYIHCNLFFQDKDDQHIIRIFGQIANALQHGRKMSKKQFDDSIEIYNKIIEKNFLIDKEIADKIYNAYYK